jgi:hypothetical protein
MPKKSSSSSYLDQPVQTKKQQQQQSFTTSFTNNINTNNSTTFNSQINNKLNQGKLIYLDKKFSNNKLNEPNYDELNIISRHNSSSNCNNNSDKLEEDEKSQVYRSSCLNNDTNENSLKRLSCEELENLKEKFIDFIKLDPNTNSSNSLPPPPPPNYFSTVSPKSNTSNETEESLNENNIIKQDSNQMNNSSSPLPSPTAALEAISNNNRFISNQSNRLSIYDTSSSSSGESSSILSKPEPPQRTVSIRNSASLIYSTGNLSNKQDDCLSIRSSSIYSSCKLDNSHPSQVKSSRSVFSIYEGDEDEGCSTTTASSSSSSAMSSSSFSSPNQVKLERLAEFEIKKIESMYRSIGSLVNVSACTCDFYTTTSEQIANLLNDCWKLEMNSIVPVWIFDTGFNLKRTKQLRLLFVDRFTSFPLTQNPIIIDKHNQLKNPNNDKRLTFTLRNKQLVCLVQFYDFFSCQEFFKFYMDLSLNHRFSDLFIDDSNLMINTNNIKNYESIDCKNSKTNKSKSMMSLNLTSDTTNNVIIRKSNNKNVNNRSKRYSDYITMDTKFDANRIPVMKHSLTIDNIKQMGNKSSSLNSSSSNNSTLFMKGSSNSTNENQSIQQTTITKNCISNPCAFQHINHISDSDQRVRFLIKSGGNLIIDVKNMISNSNDATNTSSNRINHIKKLK